MLPALANVSPAHAKASFRLVIEGVSDIIERVQFEESVVKKWMNLQSISEVLTQKTLLQIRSRFSQTKNGTTTIQQERGYPGQQIA